MTFFGAACYDTSEQRRKIVTASNGVGTGPGSGAGSTDGYRYGKGANGHAGPPTGFKVDTVDT